MKRAEAVEAVDAAFRGHVGMMFGVLCNAPQDEQDAAVARFAEGMRKAMAARDKAVTILDTLGLGS